MHLKMKYFFTNLRETGKFYIKYIFRNRYKDELMRRMEDTLENRNIVDAVTYEMRSLQESSSSELTVGYDCDEAET